MKKMFRYTKSLTMLAVALALVTDAGQWATEQYIPIGKSPGISGEYSRIGTIDAIDVDARQVTIATETGPVVVELTENTIVWVDRSKLGEANAAGSVDDLAEGLEVEVLSEERERRGEGPAAWIKVRQPS